MSHVAIDPKTIVDFAEQLAAKNGGRRLDLGESSKFQLNISLGTDTSSQRISFGFDSEASRNNVSARLGSVAASGRAGARVQVDTLSDISNAAPILPETMRMLDNSGPILPDPTDI